MTLKPQDGTTMKCVMLASNPVALKYRQAVLEPLTVIAKAPHGARNGFHPSGGVGIAYHCPAINLSNALYRLVWNWITGSRNL